MAASRQQDSDEYDAGLMLYSIAILKSWSVAGVSYSSLWGGGKTPDGIKEIRVAATSDLTRMYDIAIRHTGENITRQDKTTAFYQLVRNVYNYRESIKDQKEMIDKFCLDHLNDSDRALLPGAKGKNTTLFSTLKSLI